MQLDGLKIAALVTDGFEQSELLSPKAALEQAGATVHVVSPKDGTVKAWDGDDWGEEVAVDVTLSSAEPTAYDALLLPGGVMNPDKLRAMPEAVQFATSFFERGKPVAAICHGPWLLIEAGVAKNYTLTSYPSIRTDLKNAGATVEDKEVVIDRNLTTSRNPQDLPAFNKAIVEQFAKASSQQNATTAGRGLQN